MIENIWPIALAIAIPVSGVVGFAIQLRTVKKTRLENSKLELEIDKLKRELEADDRQIVIPTNDEVEKYRETPTFVREKRGYYGGDYKETSRFSLTSLLLYLIVTILVCYFFYDLFRLARWALNLF